MLLSLFQFHLASNHLTSDFNPSSRPPTHTLTSWSRFFYFNHPASFELFLGVPSSCDRNATHLRCIWPPPGPRQCDVAFIISSGYLPFLCHLPAPSGTFFCHMASIHPASLCSPFCEFPLYITLWQFFLCSWISDLYFHPKFHCHALFFLITWQPIELWLQHMSIIPSLYWEHPSHCRQDVDSVHTFQILEDGRVLPCKMSLLCFTSWFWVWGGRGLVNQIESCVIWTHRNSEQIFVLNFWRLSYIYTKSNKENTHAIFSVPDLYRIL